MGPASTSWLGSTASPFASSISASTRRRVAREVSAYKVRRSSGSIQHEDALSAAETAQALAAGAAIAEEEIAAGADLLIIGDMGIGNTTPAAALVAATFGVGAEEVTGRGTGIDDTGLAHKTRVIQQALDRAGERVSDPVDRLTALGLGRSGRRGGLSAHREPGPAYRCCWTAWSRWPRRRWPRTWRPVSPTWCVAGHRSTEPAQQLALDKLGLSPLLDLGLRLGEGSGAVAALPAAAVGGTAAERHGAAERRSPRVRERLRRSGSRSAR